MNTAEAIVGLVRLWFMIGALVAAVFLIIGIDRIDEDAQGAYVFRPLLVPGILLIWPLVLWRWWVLETGRDNPDARFHPVRKAHGFVAFALAGIVIATIILGLSSRQQWPADFEPERLSPPEEVSQ